MNCKDIREVLSAYLDDVLEPFQKEKVEEHLENCSACQKELEDLRKTVEVIKALGEVSPPEDFHQNLVERLEGVEKEQTVSKIPEENKQKKPTNRLLRVMKLVRKKDKPTTIFALAAVLVIGMGIGLLANQVINFDGLKVGNSAPQLIASQKNAEYDSITIENGRNGKIADAGRGESSEEIRYKSFKLDGVAENADTQGVQEDEAIPEKFVQEASGPDSGVAYDANESTDSKVTAFGITKRNIIAPNLQDGKPEVENTKNSQVENTGAVAEKALRNPDIPEEKNLVVLDTKDNNQTEVEKGTEGVEEEAVEKVGNEESNGKEKRVDQSKAKANSSTEKVSNPEQEYSQNQIIRNGWLTVEVKKFNETEKEINVITGQFNGYIESSQENMSEWKTGSFVIRIPVNKFPQALEEFEKLGKVVNKELSGEDVSVEYRDANARLRNLQRQETRLLRLVDKAESLGDVLALESELNRVRQEIEKIEGRINYFANVTEMATLHLDIHEVEEKNTPGPEGIFKRTWNAFIESCKGLINLLEAGIIFIGSAIPYLLLLAGGVAIYRYYKKAKQ